MKERLAHIDISKGIGILLIVIGHNWIIFYFTNSSMNLNTREYDTYIYSTILALIGSVIIVLIGKELVRYNQISKLLSYLGINSLYILIFHAFFQFHIMNLLIKIVANYYISSVFAFLGSIIMSLLCGYTIKKVYVLNKLYISKS